MSTFIVSTSRQKSWNESFHFIELVNSVHVLYNTEVTIRINLLHIQQFYKLKNRASEVHENLRQLSETHMTPHQQSQCLHTHTTQYHRLYCTVHAHVHTVCIIYSVQ